MRYDVFISYSSKDQKIAEGVCAYLEQQGIRCFVAYRDIPRGVVWATAIVEALEHSRMMVVLFSKNFNESSQVERELELASNSHMPILTFRLSNDDFEDAKKYYLQNLNWIDAFPNPEQAFGALHRNVASLLGMSTSGNHENQEATEPRGSKSFNRYLWIVIACLSVFLVVTVVFNDGDSSDSSSKVETTVAKTVKIETDNLKFSDSSSNAETTVVERDKAEEAQMENTKLSEDEIVNIYNQGLKQYKSKNYTEAFKLFKIAAEQGHARSQYHLGHCYHTGSGVKKNRSLAMKWYNKSADQGVREAKLFLEILENNNMNSILDTLGL